MRPGAIDPLRVAAIAALLAIASCGDDKNAPGNAAVLSAMKAERVVVEAMWTSRDILWVSVLDDGTRRDGYAQYVCDVIGEHRPAAHVVVHVWDAAKMGAGTMVELGQATCR